MEVTVSAPSHSRALAQAIALGVDAGLAQVVCPGTRASKRARRYLPDSLAQVVRVVREDAATQTLTVDVVLPAGAAERALLRSRPALARLRCLVLIAEYTPGAAVLTPVTEQLVTQGLRRAGLRLCTLPPRCLIRERARLHAGQSAPVHVRRLGRRYGCDLLFTGLATVERPAVLGDGWTVRHARLELRVLTLPDGVLVYSETFYGTGRSHTEAAAGVLALEDTGRRAALAVPGAALRAVQGGCGGTQRYVLRIAPPAPLHRITQLVDQLPVGVTAYLPSFTAHGVSIDLLYRGTAAELAQALSGVLDVTGINGVSLTATSGDPPLALRASGAAPEARHSRDDALLSEPAPLD